MNDLVGRLRARLTRDWDRGPSLTPVRVVASGYRRLLDTRNWLHERGVLTSRRLPCGVVSIGNLTVGGTGKTPAVAYAVDTLAALGARPAVVSRGYGRRSRGVQVVADGRSIVLAPEEAGDEPFLLARRLESVPVIVGENRYHAARLAVDRFGASAIVLDDGFQHRSLVKDVEIVLARGTYPWGNGRLFPAGPLREPLESLARADLIVASGLGPDDAFQEVTEAGDRYAPGVPIVAARHEPAECWRAPGLAVGPAAALAGRRLVGFAGIAYPEAFGRTLAEVGVAVAEFVPFADHHWYRQEDLGRLAARAEALGAEGLVTTEKDWVRLHSIGLPPLPLWVLIVRFRLRSGEPVWRETLGRALR
jgi:tetraacyldisaccharide 4'-kinase